MRPVTGLALSTFVTLVSAAIQLQSASPAFDAAGRQGCISATANEDGSPVIIHDCNTEDSSKHAWDLSLFSKENAGPQQIKIFKDLMEKCLDVKDGIVADGTKLQVWTCGDGNPNQQWISVNDFTFRLSGTTKCVDLTDGNITDGNQLQIWECDSQNTNQKFIGEPVGNAISPPSRLVGGPADPNRPSLCMTAENLNDGAGVSLSVCGRAWETFPAGNQTWIVPVSPLTGPIRLHVANKCLDTRREDATNGYLLQITECVVGDPKQQWKVDSPNTISWVGHNKCVDITNGNMAAGTPLQIWDCDASNPNQQWFLTQSF
ncbi:hypothetical protein E1B28_002115 [Marasmius oreades]|uniref:Ricin B lectin domain-containing protein n=1 Tax=Marasmius oreades TaxID=181124 RepID=A0A9P7RN22_9AGAR|nr:uncharacterized protein E1B28_002115 [Marasmius oreades]KAG7086155.1 hypothetical protein E1B28_002115 [Marasmius oreades]